MKILVVEDNDLRIELFKRYGYNTIIVWEKELRNLKSLKNRLLPEIDIFKSTMV